MTKEVFVTIEGVQLGSEEEAVIISSSGRYHLHNSSHYIAYEEKAEVEEVTKSTIKVTPNQISLIKKGENSSQMIFDLKEETQAVYQTPYGNLSFTIKTTEIMVNETKDRIQIKMEYSLATNAAHLSDNRINILVVAKEE